MLENIDSLNIDVSTRKAQGIILNTLYNARHQGSLEVDVGKLLNNAKTELPYFADAISILREESLIYSPSCGVFGITSSGLGEHKLRDTAGALF